SPAGGRGAGGEGYSDLPSPAGGRGAGGEGALYSDIALLFSESNSRFLCEVQPSNADSFESALKKVPHARIGEVIDNGRLEIVGKTPLIEADIADLKEAWQEPLRW
ncbi:MAG: hypothetical protein JW959_10770, partial [Pirellulales bacterium]|nr:hypothetical protein [Pirellulales bacterium]